MTESRLDGHALPQWDHYVDGRAVAPLSGQYLDTDDPFTGRPWARVARGNAGDVHAAVAAARRALKQGPWAAMSASERGRVLWRVADAISLHAPHLAAIERRDNGKLVHEVNVQVA